METDQQPESVEPSSTPSKPRRLTNEGLEILDAIIGKCTFID